MYSRGKHFVLFFVAAYAWAALLDFGAAQRASALANVTPPAPVRVIASDDGKPDHADDDDAPSTPAAKKDKSDKSVSITEKPARLTDTFLDAGFKVGSAQALQRAIDEVVADKGKLSFDDFKQIVSQDFTDVFPRTEAGRAKRDRFLDSVQQNVFARDDGGDPSRRLFSTLNLLRRQQGDPTLSGNKSGSSSDANSSTDDKVAELQKKIDKLEKEKKKSDDDSDNKDKDKKAAEAARLPPPVAVYNPPMMREANPGNSDRQRNNDNGNGNRRDDRSALLQALLGSSNKKDQHGDAKKDDTKKDDSEKPDKSSDGNGNKTASGGGESRDGGSSRKDKDKDKLASDMPSDPAPSLAKSKSKKDSDPKDSSDPLDLLKQGAGDDAAAAAPKFVKKGPPDLGEMKPLPTLPNSPKGGGGGSMAAGPAGPPSGPGMFGGGMGGMMGSQNGMNGQNGGVQSAAASEGFPSGLGAPPPPQAYGGPSFRGLLTPGYGGSGVGGDSGDKDASGGGGYPRSTGSDGPVRVITESGRASNGPIIFEMLKGARGESLMCEMLGASADIGVCNGLAEGKAQKQSDDATASATRPRRAETPL